MLATAMRKIAADPQAPTTRNRSELLPGIRSFHIRHAPRVTRHRRSGARCMSSTIA